jgi:hypothetical protein
MNDLRTWPPPSPHSDGAQGFPETASQLNRTSPAPRAVIHRTRTGCRTCRYRRVSHSYTMSSQRLDELLQVKCDETRPECTQCLKGKRSCAWPEPNDKRAKVSRRPNATACVHCRERKVRPTCWNSPTANIDHLTVSGPGEMRWN